MATTPRFRALAAALSIVSAMTFSGAHGRASHQATERSTAASFDPDLDGRDLRQPPTHRPTIEAAFPRESYAAGALAHLVIYTEGERVSLQVFRAGSETAGIVRRDLMLGSPVSPQRNVGDVRRGERIGVPIGPWPSGLYFAKLIGAGDKIGYAPFVLRPRRLGEHSVAVVFSTMTWQAYNFHDDNGDGLGDTWYRDQADRSLTARLGRPYENRGVIPHYKYYDEPFVRWLVATHRDVDYLADADLDRRTTTGRTLAQAYRLIIFPGHHEYVTPHEYDAILGYRNLGGHLMFLSANNFFWRTIKVGEVMHRTARWRELGRPEAALIGAQYFGSDNGKHRGAWIVRNTPAAKWIFAGTKLHPGSPFANGGIEADQIAASSPRRTQIVAVIPHLFGGPGSADMTYYELPTGAKVFAAGAFTLSGAVWWENVHEVIGNIWARLADDNNIANQEVIRGR